MPRISKVNGTAKVSTSNRTAGKKSSGFSWTSIVRNTTVSSANTNPSYTPVIMPGRRRQACEREKIGLQRISAVSPVVATKVNDEEYKISLNFEALKDVIQGFDELDLCGVNVKLCTVSGDTVFSGEVSFDKFSANEAEIATLSVTDTATINELEVSSTSTFNGETTFKAPVNMEDVLNSTTINNSGKITTDDFESATATITDKLTAKEIETEELKADDGEFKTLTVTEDLNSVGTTRTRGIANDWDITNTGDITNQGDFSNGGDMSNTGNFTNSGDIINQGDITNSGVVTTNELVATNATITNATISEENVAKSNITDATITRAKITSEEVTNSKIENLEATDVHVTNDVQIDWDLKVDWITDVEQLEVNSEASFRDDVKVYDNFYVSGDYTLNGEGRFNWPETHNGDVVFNGDATFNGTLTADDLDINLDEYQKREDKGRVNGYASLDDQGKVPMSQLPNIAGGITYKGGWNAWTGAYPANPVNGDMYYCTNGGTVNGTVYNVGDRIIFDSDTATWNRLPDNYGVQSVNGRTGIVVDVQDTTDRKNAIDLVNPATNKYLSEKAVADLINPLIQRIEELEEENNRMDVPDLSNDMPATMVEWMDYTIPLTGMTADTNIVVLNTNTNGNIVVTPGNWFIVINSSANETNPMINILTIKPSN